MDRKKPWLLYNTKYSSKFLFSNGSIVHGRRKKVKGVIKELAVVSISLHTDSSFSAVNIDSYQTDFELNHEGATTHHFILAKARTFYLPRE